MTGLLDHGPLIATGEIDDATYEVRGDDHPMVYVYRKVRGRYEMKQTQQGGSPIEVVAGMLAAELPKG